MNRSGLALLLAFFWGCSKPGQDSAPPSQSKAQEAPAARRPLAGGPFESEYECLLCFVDRSNPKAVSALLRREEGAGKLAGGSAQFFYLRTYDTIRLADVEGWVVAIEPSGIVYELSAKPGSSYRLKRIVSNEALPIPAWVLAASLGNMTGTPVLYDSRSGLASELISVRTSQEAMDIKKTKEVLAQVSTIDEIVLEDGRQFHSWTISTDRADVLKPIRLPKPVPLFPKVESPSSELREQKVHMTSGEIPLLHFLRFAMNWKGLPVYSAVEPAVLHQREIRVINDVDGVDWKLLEKILEINGVAIEEKTLDGVGKAILVTPE